MSRGRWKGLQNRIDMGKRKGKLKGEEKNRECIEKKYDIWGIKNRNGGRRKNWNGKDMEKMEKRRRRWKREGEVEKEKKKMKKRRRRWKREEEDGKEKEKMEKRKRRW